MENIISEAKIFQILESTKQCSRAKVLEILDKARKKKGLTVKEAAILLRVDDSELLEKMFQVSGAIKRAIYGERLVLFAPLYISNFCVNDCDYCGFHIRNREMARRCLSLKEVAEQTKILIDMGHKRLLLEFGEHPAYSNIDFVADCIKTIYAERSGNGNIRRVNVNIAATTVENYRKLKAVGIGTYQLFQETYHRETYEKLHHGPKADYERQLFAHDRAFEAGIDDLGFGVLFGLYDWRFDALALIAHAQYFDKKYGVGPHTFSVPRIQPADTVRLNQFNLVSDDDFLKIIAVLRMAVPYTGMIISTRESPEIRAKAFEIGISQTSAGSRTNPGGYIAHSAFRRPQTAKPHLKAQGQNLAEANQFQVADDRTLDEVVLGILRQGLLPSFCTACYRSGRTGKKFMDIAKPGNIHNFCRPNAILTFSEYLEDYATKDIKELGWQVIKKYLARIPSRSILEKTKQKISLIKQGKRDLYF